MTRDEMVIAGENLFLNFIRDNYKNEVTYNAGDYIMKQGQNITEVAFVELGICHVDYYTTNGQSFSFGCFFCSNRVFGDVELFSGEPCQFSVLAYEELSVKWISVHDLLKFLNSEPCVHFWLSRNLSEKYHNATKNTINQIINTIPYNIAWDIEQRYLKSRPNLTFDEAYKEAERFGCNSRSYRRAVKELLAHEFVKKEGNKLVVTNFNELQKFLRQIK